MKTESQVELNELECVKGEASWWEERRSKIFTCTCGPLFGTVAQLLLPLYKQELLGFQLSAQYMEFIRP